jgi:hypothetical protein
MHLKSLRAPTRLRLRLYIGPTEEHFEFNFSPKFYAYSVVWNEVPHLNLKTA